jgi:hypothetical protein
MTDVSNEFRDQTFDGPVDVDGRHYVNCAFNEGVQLRYGGGALPRFENCQFAGVSWYFHDAALRTIQLLQSQNMDGANQAFIDGIFRPGNLLGE